MDAKHDDPPPECPFCGLLVQPDDDSLDCDGAPAHVGCVAPPADLDEALGLGKAAHADAVSALAKASFHFLK